MEPEVEPAPPAPTAVAGEWRRLLVVLLCGALGVASWLPAVEVLDHPAALRWAYALGVAGSALAAALVGGWTARRTPDGVGGGVVAAAATAALSWALGAAPVVAAWAALPVLRPELAGDLQVGTTTAVALAAQRTMIGLTLPGALWVGLGGAFGALGAVGVPWRGWPRPSRLAVSFGAALLLTAPMLWSSWEAVTAGIGVPLAELWATGKLAVEPYAGVGLAGTVMSVMQAAVGLALVGAWSHGHHPNHANKVLFAAPLFALGGAAIAARCGDAPLLVGLVWLVGLTAGALVGLRARLTPDDRGASGVDLVQVIFLAAWAMGGGFLQASMALYPMIERIPALTAGGPEATAAPGGATDLAVYVRAMGGIALLNYTQVVGVPAGGFWVVRWLFERKEPHGS